MGMEDKIVLPSVIPRLVGGPSGAYSEEVNIHMNGGKSIPIIDFRLIHRSTGETESGERDLTLKEWNILKQLNSGLKKYDSLIRKQLRSHSKEKGMSF